MIMLLNSAFRHNGSLQWVTINSQRFTLSFALFQKKPAFSLSTEHLSDNRNHPTRPSIARHCASPRDEANLPEKDTTSMKMEKESQHKKVSHPHIWLGRITLLTVAFLWGTYSPSVKLLFTLPGPPLPSTFSVLKAVFASVLLIGGSLFYRKQGDQSTSQRPNHQMDSTESASKDHSLGDGSWMKAWLKWNSNSLLWSGMELGLWSTLGTFSQTLGISMTSAINASFLIHAVTVFTPLLAFFAGDKLSTYGWFGCVASLAGSLVVTADFSELAEISDHTQLDNSNATLGNILILFAAAFYAVATVRLGFIANSYVAIELATAKVLFQLVSSIIWILWDILLMHSKGEDWSSLWPESSNSLAWFALLWIASGPDALSAILQNRGQSIIPPSQAQILYASTPIWSAILAGPILLGDTIQVEAWVGGILVIIGGILSAT